MRAPHSRRTALALLASLLCVVAACTRMNPALREWRETDSNFRTDVIVKLLNEDSAPSDPEAMGVLRMNDLSRAVQIINRSTYPIESIDLQLLLLQAYDPHDSAEEQEYGIEIRTIDVHVDPGKEVVAPLPHAYNAVDVRVVGITGP